MTTLFEITDNPAREIAEGRGPKRYLNCVPVQVKVLPPAPPAAPWLTYTNPRSVVPRQTPKFTGEGPKMKEVLERFRATRPGEFTLSAAAVFAVSIGYAGNFPEKMANDCLKRLATFGQAMVADPARGRRPGTWKFTTAN